MTRSMKSRLSILVCTTILCALSLLGPAAVPAFKNNWQAPNAGDYQKSPPFVSYSVTPNVMIILDNSDSMNYYAYGEWKSNKDGGYDIPVNNMDYAEDDKEKAEPFDGQNRDYYGLFNPQWFYAYEDDHFEVRYKKKSYATADNTWQVVPADSVGSADENSGVISLSNSTIVNSQLWDGNWLNWISMRRIDILRKVLVGGDTKGPNVANGRNGSGDQIIYARADGMDGKYWTHSFTTGVGQAAVCPFSGTQKYRIIDGLIQRNTGLNSWGASYNLNVRKQQDYEPEAFDENGNLAGVLQNAGDRANWGNMWFQGSAQSSNGGLLSHPLGASLDDLVDDLQSKEPSTLTPLAETLCTVIQYFKQEGTVPSTNNYTVRRHGSGDPYYQLEEDGSYLEVPCRESYVLLLTDGASTDDQNVVDGYIQNDGDRNESTRRYPNGGTDWLDDVALYAHTTDLRDDLGGDQTLTLYTVYAFGNDEMAKTLLQDAARNGGFEDKDGDNMPSGWDFGQNTASKDAEDRKEWDSNEDAIPDNYFGASDGYLLEQQIKNILEKLDQTPASGTAATVSTGSSSGEGAVYQSIFYPQLGDVKWVGEVNALFVDAYGNLREDTDGNHTLNLDSDKFIIFENEEKNIEGELVEVTIVKKYTDSNANGRWDDSDKEDEKEYELQDIEYLWSAGGWLNSSDLVPKEQRAYKKSEPKRHIITFVDDGDMVAENGEVQAFEAKTTPGWDDVIDPKQFYAYIHAYDEPFQTTGDSYDVIATRIERVINFIRGEDQKAMTVDGQPLPALRSRQYNYDGEGGPENTETLRLGDIVHSSPTLAARPAENYDLLYRDKTYAAFVRAHLNRRHVVYAGANDGMLHAFNGGFYDSNKKRFLERPLNEQGEEDNDYVGYQLGAELWAYVPFNLLPHLNWLTNPDYRHIYYVDLEPRIFDAKIYSESVSDDDGQYDSKHPVHPYGWATLMVVGMRFGGGKIAADIDKSDGAYDPDEDKVMSSAYAIFDITNPEAEPKLMAEVNFSRLGFTTCHPGVVPLRNLDENNETHNDDDNKWYLVFGSGPISTTDTTTITGDRGANNDALIDGTSSEKAVFYALDLVKLAKGQLEMKEKSQGSEYMVQFDEEKSSVSKPIAVDWDLDFNTDAVYFGTSFGDHDTGWGGRLRRWVTGPDEQVNNIMLDLNSDANNLHQPIMAPPTAGIDPDGNRWVFFGTGRYMSAKDKMDTTPQAFYGVKEPKEESEEDGEIKTTFSYKQVAYGELLDVSEIEIYESADANGVGKFNSLRKEIHDRHSGWRMNFVEPGERNLGQAVLAGGILTFTTYQPSSDICDFTGTSYLYALHYLTGTAYYKDLIGVNPDNTINEAPEVLKRLPLGDSITLTPNIQVGRGSSVRTFIQTGKGGIKHLEEKDLPGRFKSGRSYWMPDIEECPD